MPGPTTAARLVRHASNHHREEPLSCFLASRGGAHSRLARAPRHSEWRPPSLNLDARDDVQPIDEGGAAGRTDMSSWTTAPAMLFLCVSIRLLDLAADSGNLPDHHPHHPHLCSTLP